MKMAMFSAMMLAVLTGATDEVYDRFLGLKQKAEEERDRFYYGVTNGMAGTDGLWVKNGGGMIFRTSGGDNMLTNIEYYVRVYTASNNLANTNLMQVSQNFQNGESCLYTYSKTGKISLIEHMLSPRGDFKCYEVGTNEDLECYYSMTNFVGEHGLMMYRNGRLMQVGGVPDFSNLRE